MARKSPSKKSSTTPEETVRGATVGLNFFKKYGLVVVLLVAYFVMALSSVANKCTTSDEIVHLTAGYSYWVDNDYRLSPEAGNLSQRWFALPLLLGDYQLPPKDQQTWWESDAWKVGWQFFYEVGNNLTAMLLAGRTMAILLGVGLCLLVYHCSSSLFGRLGGLISLTLCAFSPNILAHGRLMTMDIPAALFLLLFVWRFWIILHRITRWTLLWSCLATTGLILTKMSGVLAIPIAIILVAIRLGSKEPLSIAIRKPRQLQGRLAWLRVFGLTAVLHIFVCFLAIWAFNGFRYSAMNQFVQGRDVHNDTWEELVDEPGLVASTLNFARDNHLLPEGYLHGFAFVLEHSEARQAFLNGKISNYGWRSFFFYCLLYKTPLSLFLILAISLWAVVINWRSSAVAGTVRIGAFFYRTAPLWVLFVIYWAFAINSRLNIGHRHILPTYPPMFILAGAAAMWFKHKRPVALVAKGLTCLAVLALVVQSLLIWPHYLAFFNPIAGGPKNGYRHLVDSSLDWGQDLPGLKKWLEDHKADPGEPAEVYLAYFGNGNPSYYEIPAKLLPGRPDWSDRKRYPPPPLTGGTYCISATRLQLVFPVKGRWSYTYELRYRELMNMVEEYAEVAQGKEDLPQAVLGQNADSWEKIITVYDMIRLSRLATFLRQREPDDHVGYSILIYRLSDQEVDKALFGPMSELN